MIHAAVTNACELLDGAQIMLAAGRRPPAAGPWPNVCPPLAIGLDRTRAASSRLFVDVTRVSDESLTNDQAA
jgi:hypothetical protein